MPSAGQRHNKFSLAQCVTQHTLCHIGEGGATSAAPTKEEFLQYGVENGGDRSTLAQGLSTCKHGSVKDVTYKVCA